MRSKNLMSLGVVVIAWLGSGCSETGSATLTLCSSARTPISFVVTAEKASATGSVAPGARTTVRFRPRGEGAYAIELRRGDEVVRHPEVGYYTPRGDSSVTIADDLRVTLGCPSH